MMMSDVLVGCDIMPAGTHITASMLSGAHPAVQYTRSSILTMPFGSDGGTYRLARWIFYSNKVYFQFSLLRQSQ